MNNHATEVNPHRTDCSARGLLTLEAHARLVLQNPESVGGLGEDLFILEGLAFDQTAWDAQLAEFDPTKAKGKIAKFTPKIVLKGTKARGITLTNGGNRGANAKRATLGSLGVPEGLFDLPQSGEELTLFWEQLAGIQLMDEATLKSEAARLLTVLPGSNEIELKSKVLGAAIVPYRCQAADSFCYPLLALHSLNQQAEVLNLKTEEDLLSPEILRFLTLFWAFLTSQSKNLHFLHQGHKVQMERPEILSEGALGDIQKLILTVRAGKDGLLGVQKSSDSQLLETFHQIIGGKVSSIKIDNRPYSTAPTGISPTNPFRNEKGSSVLSPSLVLGGSPETVQELLPGYGPLLTGTRFSLDGELSYYVLPEIRSGIDLGSYLTSIRQFLLRLRSLRDEYYKCLKNSGHAKVEKALEQWKKSESVFWDNEWTNFQISNLIFAIERNVGSSNQPSFAWIQVHRNLQAHRAFLFLRELNDPRELPRVIGFLKSIQEGRTLAFGWVSNELRQIIGSFFQVAPDSQPPLDYIQKWFAWRGYLTRTNISSTPINPAHWEHAMRCLLKLNTIHQTKFNDLSSGKSLFNQVRMTMQKLDDKNEGTIRDRLRELYSNVDLEAEKSANLANWINDRAKDYGRFIDTSPESKHWTAIVDGLVVGWALKAICRKLRSGDEYKQLVGGKGLSRFSPAEIRSLMLDLRSKAERAGESPWNVDVAIEQVFLWSQKNAFSPEVTVFTDSVTLGFHRFDYSQKNPPSTH